MAPSKEPKASPEAPQLETDATGSPDDPLSFEEFDQRLRASGGRVVGRRKRYRNSKSLGLQLVFKFGTFVVLLGGLQSYRYMYPPLDSNNRMSDNFRSVQELMRSAGVARPRIELPRNGSNFTAHVEEFPKYNWSALSDVAVDEGWYALGDDLRTLVERDWKTVSGAQATHRALARLLGCVWEQAAPCDGAVGPKDVTVDWGKCQWTGKVDVTVQCRAPRKRKGLLSADPAEQHEAEWEIRKGVEEVCIAGAPGADGAAATGLLKYIRTFGFYGGTAEHCARADPAALLAIFGITKDKPEPTTLAEL